jgi:serine/threonine protein kinase
MRQALRELHELGVVHHDISHNNVLYSIPTGELTIIDFEVATNRRLGSTWSEFAPVGTPGYLAPELLDSCGWSLRHSTAQHSTAQHSTAQHSTAQHSTAQHSTAQHSTAQHSTAQHETNR